MLEHGGIESCYSPDCYWRPRISHKKLVKNLEMINFVKGVEPLQKACLLGTARIIRKVLDFGN